MNYLILCEGKTDVVFLSYYLGKVSGWVKEESKKMQKNKPFLPATKKSNEFWCYYTRGNDLLLIWGIGGKDRFPQVCCEVMEQQQRLGQDAGFANMAIVTDRDTAADCQEVCDHLATHCFHTCSTFQLTNNQWSSYGYTDEFGKIGNLLILPLVIPFERSGALETFLLQAIAEEDDDHALLVKQCCDFIANFRSERYLAKDRERLKAELSTVFAVMSPEKVFDFWDQVLSNTPWERYRAVQNNFVELERM